MIDSILSGALALGVLIGGTAAFGFEALPASQHTAQVAMAAVTLPTVTVVGQRHPANVVIARR